MAKYVIIAPDGNSVTVSSGYGQMTLKHGAISNNDKLAAIFPSIFKKMKEEAPIEKKVVIETKKELILEVPEENKTTEIITEVPEENKIPEITISEIVETEETPGTEEPKKKRNKRIKN